MKEFNVKISDLKKLSCKNLKFKDCCDNLRSFEIMNIILESFFKLRGEICVYTYDVNNLFKDKKSYSAKLLKIYDKLREENISKLTVKKKYDTNDNIYLIVNIILEDEIYNKQN